MINHRPSSVQSMCLSKKSLLKKSKLRAAAAAGTALGQQHVSVSTSVCQWLWEVSDCE